MRFLFDNEIRVTVTHRGLSLPCPAKTHTQQAIVMVHTMLDCDDRHGNQKEVGEALATLDPGVAARRGLLEGGTTTWVDVRTRSHRGQNKPASV